MALNPIVYTEKIVHSFLRYQLTAYPFADERLLRQMRQLLSLDATRSSPLLKGPYISISRPFRRGASVDKLVADGVFHPLMRERIPPEIEHVYGHQEEAIRAIHAGHTTLISTGTGSGKTECFLYPIVSKCLALRDVGAAPGISAVIVYPMNALAEDQLGRLRGLLAGTGIPFGMYVGKTPEHAAQVTGIRLPPGSSRADYEARLAKVREERRSDSVHPAEELCSREEMRRAGGQPRILLTNVKQLELLLTRQRDVELFAGARLDFLVFDEAHTFAGAHGAETACLIRRLRAFCGREAQDTVCVATSATIVDQHHPDAAREFASRFFGVPADAVTTVGEAYERETWADARTLPPAPAGDPAALLDAVVQAVEDPSGAKVRAVYPQLARAPLADGEWTACLYDALARNELVYQLDDLLRVPAPLADIPKRLHAKLGRSVTEAEILAWLTLGAAARKDNRPLIRPVVHVFVRGIGGAVVTFPLDSAEPRLWLAAEDEHDEDADGTKHAHFPVTTCTTCGQHYFIAFLKDFAFTGKRPGGGEASGDSGYWEPLDEAVGGKRVILLDRIIGGSGDDDDLDEHERLAPLYFCRSCGTAHPDPVTRCRHCGVTGDLVPLYAVRQNEKTPGHLSSCLSCGANGRRIGSYYREPARPVRATNVADVHVLAQDTVHHAERKRLLVFCDNRQDAAFQAGWMKDHARRFRLRALMADGLKGGAVSVGDLTLYLDDLLDHDESLSRALAPEVWQVVRKEGGGGRHEQERRKFLRIQVLREVTLSSRQSIGLEPWGRMKVDYEGLETGLPWIQQAADQLGLPPEDVREGVAGVLDYLRRKRALYDPEREIFGHYWMEGDQEIQQGYLPQLGNPLGTKLRRGADEESKYVSQWLSDRGDTVPRQLAKKWGVAPDAVEPFLEGLFRFLVDRGLLRAVTLKGSRRNALPRLSGLYQVDADRLRLQHSHGVWRCRSCRRRFARRAPHDACPAWRCDGTLEFVAEDRDNYDLQLLDQGYSMIRPEEHTAMVPHEERERLENLFKGESDAVNAFVCTPTLELGVDIGQLDSVLMRNVPPLPANYWQRAGRAGRRHRMAVDVTYCRPVSHDHAYFVDPLKLLTGRVDPPAFNLRNEFMVAKHVHATVITRLHQYVRDPARTAEERTAIDGVLKTCLPQEVSTYLFDGGQLRGDPFDLEPLRQLINADLDDLCGYVERAFQQGWPKADDEVVAPEALRRHVENMTDGLREVLARLGRRLAWALNQIQRLNAVRAREGTLEPEDDALFRRCDTLIKRLKGTAHRRRREAEGYDDVNTFGVLAAEGFLPGYGLEVGSVLGTAEIPFWRTGAMQFTLPRPPSVALREYVPGNLIYANGNRFVARRFHRDADESTSEMPTFEVDPDRHAVRPMNVGAAQAGLGTHVIQAISVSDVDLVHQSHISDEEEFRFQMGVAVYGREQGQHNGGRAYRWGAQPVQLRRGVRLRLVNVGSTTAIDRFDRFGYPVCTVCGQSVSPLSSDRQRELFEQQHRERCGREIRPLGFYAGVVADALSLPGCPDQKTAYSVLEALRTAAAHILDMTLDDLQILVIGHVDRDDVDGLLWDPMPGGSGLLDQVGARFGEIVAEARRITNDCPAACETSCVDCLRTFRNGFYHQHLDRHVAAERMGAWGDRLVHDHDIPARQPSQAPVEGAYPVNGAEQRLRHLLLSAGFEEGLRGEQIRLEAAIGTTTPDVIYPTAVGSLDESVCIYLDGLSEHIHGNPATAEKDVIIRGWLRNHGYEVIEIAASDLADQAAMTRHFRKLAKYLSKPELRDRLGRDSTWFAAGQAPQANGSASVVHLIHPRPQDRYVTCVPLVPLKAAAGGFGDSQAEIDESEPEDWVAVGGGRRLTPGMFAAQVVGHSMEPKIPDGAYCLFSAPVQGSRQGRDVLVQLHDASDPDTGERYTIKRYESRKVEADDEAWRHIEITLKPLNPSYAPITLTVEDEGAVRVVAEFMEVVGQSLEREP